MKFIKAFYGSMLMCGFWLFLLSCGTSYANTQSNILILGDSLSSGYKMDPQEGWVALLQNKLNECSSDYKVINLSTSGDTTRTGLQKINPALEKYTPNLIVIELGGNDGLRGLPLFSIKSNLKKLIQTSLDAHTRVLLVTIKLPPNYGQDYTDQFHQMYLDLAKEFEIPLTPFILENIALNKELMHRDGIHPKAQAQPLIVEHLYPAVIKVLDLPESYCKIK